MAIYRCRRCENEQPEPWEAECPSCGGFYRPIKVRADTQAAKVFTAAMALTDAANVTRIPTGIENVDAVLGGGFVERQTVLFAGPPGCGKSRLALQILQSLVERQERSVVFASSEEHPNDVFAMCKQVGATSERIRVFGVDDDGNFDIRDVLAACDEIKPVVLCLDSLQAADGWTSQNQETAQLLKNYCDKSGMCALVMNHMTGTNEVKGGTAAAHMFKAMMFIHEYDSRYDGKIVPTFGKRFKRRVDEGEINLVHMRALFTGKNRSGASAKSFFIFDEHGKLQPLPTKAPKRYPVGVDDGDEEEEAI